MLALLTIFRTCLTLNRLHLGGGFEFRRISCDPGPQFAVPHHARISLRKSKPSAALAEIPP